MRMMSEKYIKISDVMKKLNYIFRAYGTSPQMKEQIRDAIRKIPYVVKGELETTLEGVDVVGKWIQNKYVASSRCSKCRGCFTDEPPYCPKCGAKMDGGDEDA